MNSLEGFVRRIVRHWKKKKDYHEKTWEGETIVHPLLGEWGRSLEEYEKKMLFDRSELQGKTVLDLGAGPGLRLCEDIKACDIGARVISLSPDFVSKGHRTRAQMKAPGNEMIAGLGQTLPFVDESFDCIFCFHVIEHIKTNGGFYFDFITEMARVLKHGGVARLGSCYDVPNEWDGYATVLNHSATMKKLSRYGAVITKEIVPESIIPRQKVKDVYANAFYVLAYNLVIKRI